MINAFFYTLNKCELRIYMNIKFNSKYITLFLIISALLFCVSSVCAQDTNATNNINNIKIIKIIS